MGRRTGCPARLSLASAVAGCLFASVANAAGGGIMFSGAIVPSSYGIQLSSTAPAASGTELRFVASASGPQSATVRIERLNREPVPIRCSDGLQPAPARGCPLGAQGGSLSLVALDGGRPAAAVVITSYD
ncbi:hypothetical protein [Variovorax saccharolyticus]|uniref:hypothetical protein n=1 Tax=Variovorax saccharolyticus TaxID=3053516 RepID=UPI002576F731|nr:hypothetical protein [Variovorax sp. J31P216]MDM0023762.1 hypothetical protein [Variovorax sp. J31P216]